MRLIDTHVGTLTEGTITVEFQGEGGELVSVRMISDASLDPGAAVLRAKELMVQLSAFEARNETEKSGGMTRTDKAASPDNELPSENVGFHDLETGRDAPRSRD
jgi:hypothetical protein